MGRSGLTVAAVMMLLLAAIAAGAERVNKSASVGRFLSSEKDDGDLLGWKSSADDDLSDPAVEEEERGSDGGFSSLDGMLQWAIGHSDPAKLKEATVDIQRLSPEDLKNRQLELKELMEKLKMPSDAKLMQIAIDDLNNSSLTLEDRHRALQELLILVEPIDNANDLHKLGGLTAIVQQLYDTNLEIRTIAAWIIGKACQNNLVVQNQVLELGTLVKLIEMAQSDFIEEAIKALYAISALIRNNSKGQELFYKQDGSVMLQNFLSNSSIDIRLLRKSVFLLADLVESQLDDINKVEPPFFSNHSLLKSVVDLMGSADLDLQEKALYAVKNLLLLGSGDAIVFKDVCQLDVALRRMKQKLQQLVMDDNEYAQDMEKLRKEVELLFARKLDQRRKAFT